MFLEGTWKRHPSSIYFFLSKIIGEWQMNNGFFTPLFIPLLQKQLSLGSSLIILVCGQSPPYLTSAHGGAKSRVHSQRLGWCTVNAKWVPKCIWMYRYLIEMNHIIWCFLNVVPSWKLKWNIVIWLLVSVKHQAVLPDRLFISKRDISIWFYLSFCQSPFC